MKLESVRWLAAAKWLIYLNYVGQIGNGGGNASGISQILRGWMRFVEFPFELVKLVGSKLFIIAGRFVRSQRWLNRPKTVVAVWWPH